MEKGRRVLLIAVAVSAKEQRAHESKAKNAILAPGTDNVLHFCNGICKPKEIEALAKTKRTQDIVFYDLTTSQITAIVTHLTAKCPGKFTFYAMGKIGVPNVSSITSLSDLLPKVGEEQLLAVA